MGKASRRKAAGVPRPAPGTAPATAAAELEAALRLIQAGRPGHAEYVCRDILKADPDNAEASNLLGVCRVQQGDPEGGLPCLHAALKTDPRHVRAHYNLGCALT